MATWMLITALPLFTLVVAIFNTITWRRGDASFSVSPGTLSVLIPARNEERHIRDAVESVLNCRSSDAVVEVLVYDDGSTDATADLVRRISRKDERVKLIVGSPLPRGWVGKPYACHRLADVARGELFLFMDADVRLKRDGLERLLSLRSAPACGKIVSAVPRQLSGGFFERLVIPMLLLTYLAWLPLRLVEWGTNPRTVAANGQLLLLARSDYHALGGFSAVKNEIVDDVAFCRHAKKSGYRVVFADGFHVASCRMYHGTRETIAGFAKNLFEGVGSARGLAFVCLLYVGAFLLPYFTLARATWELHTATQAGAPLLAPSLVGVACVITLRALLAARFGQPWSGVVLHPFSIFSFLFIAGMSSLWQLQRSIVWRGRSYEPLAFRKAIRSRDASKPRDASRASSHTALQLGGPSHE